ncbi:hypothetical protein EPA93_31940 [Ktedonosporobacter rubrisoli]|uniref:Uncharacterized protein n=1 Tax=Ktedonosporobacter rubrisoli TaxID=2509675 RepID=A0A4P6JXX7_KTERU|nr:hypothetical protein [Ktedonosporobacter rubrisoli]QBD80335.1 hypothetical protein EPA93_31940 [Ktedonosporobacter rubrisoli]
MRHADRPQKIPEAVALSQFPVYGLPERPSDLTICSHGLGISQFGNIMSISFTFTSPRYSSGPCYAPESQNFVIISLDSAVQDLTKEPLSFDLNDPYNMKYERKARRDENPTVWEGTLSLANITFSGKILQWIHPPLTTAFLFTSKLTILFGHSYGPAFGELLQLLQSLQIVNRNSALLKQYQYEYDNQRSPILDNREL